MSENEPRRIPIHRSINRQHLLLGGERNLVQFSALLAGLMFFSGFSVFSFVCAITFWIIALAALSRMGKSDPKMSEVYRRHILYKDYYPAKTGIYAPPTIVRTGIK